MSPILTRPVREQLEHDRVIRLLQARYKRKTEVIINPGNEQNQSVTVGELVVFPDLLVFAEGGRRLLVTVEVETGESVNAIEARAEWGVYSKLKVPLHLYVPPPSVDAARRLCAEYQIVVAEVWTFTTTFDQVRFTMVHKDNTAPQVKVPVKAPKPAPTVRHAQDGAARGRGAKATPAAKAKPAKAVPAAKARPKKKPAVKKAKPAAKKARPSAKKNARKRR